MPKKKKLKRQRRLPLVVGAGFFLGIFIFYVFSLNYKIHAKFESHRWNLPSRVYSDSFSLYPGQTLTPQQLEKRLERLHYKRVTGEAHGVGEFVQEAHEFQVYLHDFSYPSEEFVGFPVRITFQDRTIGELQRMDHAETLKRIKLEPELIASIFDEKMEDRTLVSLSEVPPTLIKGVVALEDERFYEHKGVDPRALVRALLTDVIHFRYMQGGSTLTQQLVKNYFLHSRKTLLRKMNEILMALLLERQYSKNEILEAYFNEIYFGQRGPVSVTGIQEASTLYFSKNVSQLTVGEAALLAGMIRSPGEYSPLNNLERAYDRRNFVLKTMLEQDKLTEPEYQAARQEKIVTPKHFEEAHRAAFFVDYVQQELKRQYPPEVLQSEGIKIFTPLDMDAQEAAEQAVSSRLKALEAGRGLLKEQAAHGKLLEGLLLAIQPQSGFIRAFVGGRDFVRSQFDRIVDAHRQPGSTFKPFVYLTALQVGAEAKEGEERWTLVSPIEDKAFSVPGPNGVWSPQNYDKQEHGTVTLRQALENSYNLATSKLAQQVGLDTIVTTARKLGIESPLEAYPAIALGIFEVTPLELIRAYSVFPNQGIRSEPVAITSVVTREGMVLERKGIKMNRAISPDLAYLMNEALRGVVDRGTGAVARTLGYTGLAAGKTGTTSDYRDSWFVGYTPDLLALSWVGYDDGTTTGLSGSSGALPIWVDFMKQTNPPGASRVDFPATENIVLEKIAKSGGGLYRDSCGEPFEEVFLRGTEPTEYCTHENE